MTTITDIKREAWKTYRAYEAATKVRDDFENGEGAFAISLEDIVRYPEASDGGTEADHTDADDDLDDWLAEIKREGRKIETDKKKMKKALLRMAAKLVAEADKL